MTTEDLAVCPAQDIAADISGTETTTGRSSAGEPLRPSEDLTIQIDIFGGEHTLAPPAAPASPETFEPRLFEPQYEGQLALAGGDYPNERTDR